MLNACTHSELFGLNRRMVDYYKARVQNRERKGEYPTTLYSLQMYVISERLFFHVCGCQIYVLVCDNMVVGSYSYLAQLTGNNMMPAAV